MRCFLLLPASLFPQSPDNIAFTLVVFFRFWSLNMGPKTGYLRWKKTSSTGFTQSLSQSVFVFVLVAKHRPQHGDAGKKKSNNTHLLRQSLGFFFVFVSKPLPRKRPS